MRGTLLGLAILALPAFITSCKRPDEQPREQAIETTPAIPGEGRAPGEARPVPGQGTTTERDAFSMSAKQELDRLDRNLDQLKERASRLTAQEKATVDAQIEALENRYDAVKKSVDDLGARSDAELSELRQTIESSMRDLQRSYEELAAKLGSA